MLHCSLLLFRVEVFLRKFALQSDAVKPVRFPRFLDFWFLH